MLDRPAAWSATSVWFSGPRRVELRDEEVPEPDAGQLLVRSMASGISHGTEMLVYRGQVPGDLPLDLPTLAGSFRFPIKYGYANVGRVIRAGPGVERPREGELVFAHHPHQTTYVVEASAAVPLPSNIGPEAAVFLANLETSVNVMLDAGVRLGERVVIFGQGVVGLLLSRLCRLVGAGLVVAVDPLARRRETAARAGADAALDPGDDLKLRVRELTSGAGADVVLEASGNPAALALAMDCAAFQGSVVVCSWYGVKPATLPLGSSFHRNRLRVVSSQVSAIEPSLHPRWDRRRRMGVALDLLPGLGLETLVTQRIPFEDAASAYRLVDEHPEDVIQVILTYGSADV